MSNVFRHSNSSCHMQIFNSSKSRFFFVFRFSLFIVAFRFSIIDLCHVVTVICVHKYVSVLVSELESE